MSCSLSQTIRCSVASISSDLSLSCHDLLPAVSPLVDDVTDPDSSTTHQDDAHQPHAHKRQLGVTDQSEISIVSSQPIRSKYLPEQVQTKLETEDQLGEGDHEEDPALGTQSLTPDQSEMSIVCINQSEMSMYLGSVT